MIVNTEIKENNLHPFSIDKEFRIQRRKQFASIFNRQGVPDSAKTFAKPRIITRWGSVWPFICIYSKCWYYDGDFIKTVFNFSRTFCIKCRQNQSFWGQWKHYSMRLNLLYYNLKFNARDLLYLQRKLKYTLNLARNQGKSVLI